MRVSICMRVRIKSWTGVILQRGIQFVEGQL